MEVEESRMGIIRTSIEEDLDVQEKDPIEEEVFTIDETIEVENSSMKSVPTETADPSPISEQASENGKKKTKEEKPPTKIVVRRLPPTMTKEQFLEQVSPLPDIDHMYYVRGNVHDNVNPFSRAYLNFVQQDDLFAFSNTFDNYVFLDAKGQEFPAVVEFNKVQRFPKQRSKKKDPLVGTIESDPAWIAFKENLLAEALENSKSQKATKQHYFETEISTAEEVNTTPLLEFLKVRRAEKARLREERREEKKRKEMERKLRKTAAKEKKGEEDQEEGTKDIKIQDFRSENYGNENDYKMKNLEKIREPLDIDKKMSILKSENANVDTAVDSNKYSKPKTVINKNDKFISLKESSVHDGEETKVKEAEQQTIFLRKLLGLHPSDSQKSSNNNEVLPSRERRDIKERDNRGNKKKDEREKPKEPRVREFKRGGKSYQEERLKLAEKREEKKKEVSDLNEKKPVSTDDVSIDPSGDPVKSTEEKVIKIEKKKYDNRKTEDLKDDKKRIKSEKANVKRDRKDEYKKRGVERRNIDGDLRKKGKNYKNSEVRTDKKKTRDKVEQDLPLEKDNSEIKKSKSKSYDDLTFTCKLDEKNNENPNKCSQPEKEKRSRSLDNQPFSCQPVLEVPKKDKSYIKKQSDGSRSRKELSGKKSELRSSLKKKERSGEKRDESSKEKNVGGGKGDDGGKAKGNEGGTGGGGDTKEVSKTEDKPRTERRIRNKDRPSLEIYRPGMGKFSKQRLEKEKALGSSTEVESPSHSPSPTPRSKLLISS